jgi:hypothetical protein
MNGAIVVVSAGGTCGNGEFFIRVECSGFLKLFLHAHDGVRFFVSVDPCDFLSGLLAPSAEASFSAWPRVKLVKRTKLIANRIWMVVFLTMDVCID